MISQGNGCDFYPEERIRSHPQKSGQTRQKVSTSLKTQKRETEAPGLHIFSCCAVF